VKLYGVNTNINVVNIAMLTKSKSESISSLQLSTDVESSLKALSRYIDQTVGFDPGAGVAAAPVAFNRRDKWEIQCEE
jgi:hypothetical protein